MTRAPHARIVAAIATVAAAAVLGVIAIVDPAEATWFPPCAWRAATGWLCPGCGSARALHALLHGDLAAAFQMNAIAVAALPIGSVDLLQRLRGRAGLATERLPAAALWLLAGAIMGFGVIRNVA